MTFLFGNIFREDFALIDTDMWLIVKKRWNFNDLRLFKLSRHAVFALIAWSVAY